MRNLVCEILPGVVFCDMGPIPSGVVGAHFTVAYDGELNGLRQVPPEVTIKMAEQVKAMTGREVAYLPARVL